MTLSALTHRQVPAYHKWMYLDGYTPEQIMYAFRKSQQKQNIEAISEQLSQTIDEALHEILKDFNK